MIPAEQFQLFLIRNSTIAQPYKSTVKKRLFFFVRQRPLVAILIIMTKKEFRQSNV